MRLGVRRRISGGLKCVSGPARGRGIRRWVGSLGMSAGAIALMAACNPGGPLPMASPSPGTPGPSPTVTPSPAWQPVVVPLPGVASAPPSTVGAPEVVIRSRTLTQDLDGWWRLEGTLTNTGELPAREVSLTARLYDRWGVLLDTRVGIVTPNRLEPAQEGRYLVTWPPEREPASVTLEPAWVFIPD